MFRFSNFINIAKYYGYAHEVYGVPMIPCC